MINRNLRAVFLAAALATALNAHAHDGEPAATAGDSIEPAAQPVVEVVEQFSGALKSGNLDRAGGFLADDVLVLESGGAERSRAEYLGGHAGHDAVFLKDAHVQLKRRTARVEGDLAWVGTESEIHANKDGKPLTLLSTESMVLQRSAQGWKIVHIHWSSRPAQVIAPAEEGGR